MYFFLNLELDEILRTRVFGEHIAIDTIRSHLEAHFDNENPSKALALSLHGGPGTGKTYLTNLVKNQIYKEGPRSKYVRILITSIDFPHTSKEEEYKVYL